MSLVHCKENAGVNRAQGQKIQEIIEMGAADNSKFFFILRANVYNPDPSLGSPCIMIHGVPLFFSKEHDAVMFAKSLFSKGGFDAVLVYSGDWNCCVHQLYRADRYSSGELQMPEGYAAAVTRSAGDAADVLRKYLDEEFSTRS